MTTSHHRQRRAAVYVRISSDPTGRSAGVERQEQDCRTLAEQLGWTVVAIHRDNDISAYSGAPRKAYQGLLADIRAETVDAVLAWHPDRLYRRLPDLAELIEAVQSVGAEIRTVCAGAVDLNTASGRMNAKILAAVAEHEVEHSIERITAAKAQAAAEGRYRGGPRPFGYEADGTTIREDEAHWVRYATRAVIDGESLRSICRTLAENGVKTGGRRKRQEDGTRSEPVSRDWTGEELRRLLLRARNAGLLEVAVVKDGKKSMEVTGKAAWPALVDEETWRACRAVLQNPARRTTTGNGRVWLLSGIARCWCGATLRGSTSGVGGTAKAKGGKTHKTAYRCREQASHVIRDTGALDAYIEQLAVARLARPDAAELHLKVVPAEPAEDFDAQAANLRARLEELAADYAQDLLTRQQMLDATAITRERLGRVEARMLARASRSVLASVPLGSQDVVEAWKGYHLDRRRQIVDALMVITVYRARRGRPPGWKPGVDRSYFDASTVSVEWKPPQ